MLALEFPGCRRLLAMIDQAVAAGDDKTVTDALRNGLSDAIRDGEIQLPDCVLEPVADHYARRELYRCEESGYSVVAMTWGPGQGTSIHDHSGVWCVEGIWHGQLEITQYDLKEQAGDRFRFVPVGTHLAGAGSAGSLIPPHEYHTIRNPSASAIAVSLHIYKQALTCCAHFHPTGDGWYTKADRQLGLDEAA
ncbi:cysteine dioxygenase [Arenimonas sp. MALMAid1274]|uniref:cysteine dioxygenase family protein n=1 Tax=Arenimonas sp. MALMAid1274 TaxID=3411630 RepID=UPI003BA02E13